MDENSQTDFVNRDENFQHNEFSSQIENQDFLADQIMQNQAGFGLIAPELMQFKENWSFDKKQR